MGKSKIKKSSSTNTFYTIINNQLIDFLKSFPKKENTPHTHLSMGHPKGSFYIPDDRLNDFYKIYAEVAFGHKVPVHMVEMNKEYGPIKIDLDFRYYNNTAERIYKQSHIEEFVMEYMAICESYLNIDDADERICIITERDEARLATSSNGEIKKNMDGVPCIKDGIHIMFPEIHTHYSLQMKFRELILKKCDQIFGDLNLSNSYSDVIDKSIIKGTGWMMFGSTKPNATPYEITRVLTVFSDNVENREDFELNKISSKNLVALLSIRNKDDEESTILEDKVEEVEQLKQDSVKKSKYKLMKNSMKKNGYSPNRASKDKLDIICKYIDILSAERAESYPT